MVWAFFTQSSSQVTSSKSFHNWMISNVVELSSWNSPTQLYRTSRDQSQTLTDIWKGECIYAAVGEAEWFQKTYAGSWGEKPFACTKWNYSPKKRRQTTRVFCYVIGDSKWLQRINAVWQQIKSRSSPSWKASAICKQAFQSNRVMDAIEASREF